MPKPGQANNDSSAALDRRRPTAVRSDRRRSLVPPDRAVAARRLDLWDGEHRLHDHEVEDRDKKAATRPYRAPSTSDGSARTAAAALRCAPPRTRHLASSGSAASTTGSQHATAIYVRRYRRADPGAGRPYPPSGRDRRHSAVAATAVGAGEHPVGDDDPPADRGDRSACRASDC